ncbi:MAG TPA: RnfABCDGE type electron transport complex subunit D [Kiritimatiellae bacterium]|nr:RnfABCDGE type electron transport complex subunit D [Kiritimatiellia bacterium]
MNNAPGKENTPLAQAPTLSVGPSPHMVSRDLSTRRMMADVIIALLPVIVVSFYIFRWFAIYHLLLAVITCVSVEALSMRLLRRPPTIQDGSAVVTGLIFALSLPGTAPWYVNLIGAAAGIFLGKVVFGGLGQNIFNPAMVGRAFVMIAFPAAMGASGYVSQSTGVDILTSATPLTALKQMGQGTSLMHLLMGDTNGSLGETSALACLVGGFYLCARGTASWRIPAGVLLAVTIISSAAYLIHPTPHWTPLHHLSAGALLLGAFFIATDPVTSPVTRKGRWTFGIGIGTLVMLIRYLSGYPEGVMFSVLLMNSAAPLVDRLTVPLPLGGSPGKRKP